MRLWKKRVEPFEEVEYEPVTVLELLTEMKDVSELMTSLAYSALILDSVSIGEEVEELARRMDLLKYQMRVTASLSVRTTEEAEQVAGILQVADASEHIANAASDMVELLEASVNLRPFLGRVLDEADDRIGTVKVAAGCPLDNRSLGQLMLETEIGLRVIAIRQGKRWRYAPRADVVLHADDMLVIRGQQESADHLRAYIQGEVDEL